MMKHLPWILASRTMLSTFNWICVEKNSPTFFVAGLLASKSPSTSQKISGWGQQEFLWDDDSTYN